MTRHTMRAVAIDGFGGPEKLMARTLPVPEPGGSGRASASMDSAS